MFDPDTEHNTVVGGSESVLPPVSTAFSIMVKCRVCAGTQALSGRQLNTIKLTARRPSVANS